MSNLVKNTGIVYFVCMLWMLKIYNKSHKTFILFLNAFLSNTVNFESSMIASLTKICKPIQVLVYVFV